MIKKPGESRAATTVRRRVNTFQRITSQDVAAMSITSVQQLVRELQVYQLELEMQNEELRRTQAELEAVRGRQEYVSVGQVTLNGQSLMIEASSMAVTLLGFDRDGRMGSPQSGPMATEPAAGCSTSNQVEGQPGSPLPCELRLWTEAGVSRWLYVESLAADGSSGRGMELRSIPAPKQITVQQSTVFSGREALLQGARTPVGPMSRAPLSPPERQMMTLVAEGKTNKEIGMVLGISEKTIRNLLTAVFKKIGARRRSQAAVIFSCTWNVSRNSHES